MSATVTNYKAAIVVSEPAWFDLETCVQKTIHWIDEAGKAGCRLVAFPETWIPGYPFWLWKYNYMESLPLIKAYRENSLMVDSEEMKRIRLAVRKNRMFVSLGFSEIDSATCFLAQVLIGPDGQVINHRRKIKPTHVEKLIFGDGSGDTFTSVSETSIGRLGQLNCWENFNPFLKSLNIAMGEQVHVAAWPLGPGESNRSHPDPKTNTGDAWADQITPAYAMETCTWTLAPFQVISHQGVKRNTLSGAEPEANIDHYNGFSRIYAPDGTCVARADKTFDGLLMAEIDINATHIPKAINDFGGSYMRPDLIRLLVDTRRKELVTEAGREDRITIYSTRERLGLDTPLDTATLPDANASLVEST